MKKWFKLNIDKVKTRSFFLPFILNKLDINIPEDAENITKYAFGVFILSLVALLEFINVIGYFLSLHFIQRYELSKKIP